MAICRIGDTTLHSAAVARPTHKRNEIKQTTIKILQHFVLVSAGGGGGWRLVAANCNACYFHRTKHEQIRQTFTFLIRLGIVQKSNKRTNEQENKIRAQHISPFKVATKVEDRDGMKWNAAKYVCALVHWIHFKLHKTMCNPFCVRALWAHSHTQRRHTHRRDTIVLWFVRLCIIFVLRKTKRKK